MCYASVRLVVLGCSSVVRTRTHRCDQREYKVYSLYMYSLWCDALRVRPQLDAAVGDYMAPTLRCNSRDRVVSAPNGRSTVAFRYDHVLGPGEPSPCCFTSVRSLGLGKHQTSV